MNYIFAGKGERGLACLRYLVKNNFSPVLVIGQPGDSAGMINFAKASKLSTIVTKNINDEAVVFQLKKLQPDLLVLAGFTQILKKPVINLAKKGTINLHGGKLPQYRGASVLNWQIINGETVGGLSIIFVDEGVDTGDIIAKTTFPIKSSDTIKEVVDKSLELFPPLLLSVLQQFASGKVQHQPQPAGGKYWRKRKPEDGYFNSKVMTAKQIYDFVRALTKPYPGAFTDYKGKRIIVWKVRVIDQPSQADSTGIILRTKDKPVLVTDFS